MLACRAAARRALACRLVPPALWSWQDDPADFFPKRYFATVPPDAEVGPSKVLHFRNVLSEVDEYDLRMLVNPFGAASHIVFLRSRNQALVEMENLEEAVDAMKHFSSEPPCLKGKEVLIEYSLRKELDALHKPNDPNCRIVLATITNPLYHITVDIIHKVFSPHGDVERIHIFQNKGFQAIQALVQFTNSEGAARVKQVLTGREIFDGCCKLHIVFSFIEEVCVLANNELSRDYTNPSLPTSSRQIQSSLLGPPTPWHLMNLKSPLPSPSHQKCTILVCDMEENVDEDNLYHLFSNYGKVVKIRRNPQVALVQMGDAFQAELVLNHLQGVPLFGSKLSLKLSKHPEVSHTQGRYYGNKKFNGFFPQHVKNLCGPSKMLHVSSLPDDVEERDLMDLLDPHGAVRRVKLFTNEFSGKKQAIVEFDKVEEATEALACKQFARLRDFNVRLGFSKVVELQ